MNKSVIRKFYKSKNNNLAKFQIRYPQPQLLTNHKLYKSAKNIGFYLAYKQEINLSLIINHSLALGKNCYFPVCKNHNLEFHQGNNQWQTNKFGILEPKNSIVINDKLDCIFVPSLACDLNNYRLGSGLGFYDRYLYKNPTKTIAIIHPTNLCDTILPDTWDIPVTEIIFTY